MENNKLAVKLLKESENSERLGLKIVLAALAKGLLDKETKNKGNKHV